MKKFEKCLALPLLLGLSVGSYAGHESGSLHEDSSSQATRSGIPTGTTETGAASKALADKVKHELRATPELSDAINLSVTAHPEHPGMIVLDGSVRNDEQAKKALEVAKKVEGVKEVKDELVRTNATGMPASPHQSTAAISAPKTEMPNIHEGSSAGSTATDTNAQMNSGANRPAATTATGDAPTTMDKLTGTADPHMKHADEMNKLLKNEISAVQTYNQALEKERDKSGKEQAFKQLSTIADDHKEAVSRLEKHVRELGAQPAQDSGAWGTWSKTVMGTAKLLGDKAALKALKEGEESGLKDYREALQSTKEAGVQVSGDMENLMNDRITKAQENIHTLDKLMETL